MATRAVEVLYSGPSTNSGSYDSTKINLGALIRKNSGSNAVDNFAGPMKISMARVFENSGGVAGQYPHIVNITPTMDWVFLSDGSTAAATRRIQLYTFNKSSLQFSWRGAILLTYPGSPGAHTTRGMRAIYERYETGSASINANGLGVTGSGTTWVVDKLASGSRFQAGNIHPYLTASEWSYISTIDSNTRLTLTTPIAAAGSSSLPYSIEDLRILTTSTTATNATSGGLYIAKGITYDDFTPGTTTINAATTVDNVKAVYQLLDGTTNVLHTNTNPCGVAIDDRETWISQSAYVLDTTTARVFKYNIRKPLPSLASGKDFGNTTQTRTGNQAVVGTISQNNNGRVGTLGHGPGSGSKALYFVTTTRIYRSNLTAITTGSTSWQSDVMTEIPPGGTTTYAASATLSSLEIAGSIDRLVIMNTGAAGSRSYVTQYNTVGDSINHIWLVDDKQLDQSTADSGGVIHPSIQATFFNVWVEEGIAYMMRNGATAVANQLYTLPIGAHWTYALSQPNQLLISPAIDTSDANKLYRVYTNEVSKLGDDTFSLATEPYRIYYRTSGISDNTGGWTLLDGGYSLSGIAPGAQIQFAYAFKILGTTCIPARILSTTLIYEDNSTDSHYEPSVSASSLVSASFAYRQGVAWGSNIPNMRIRLYNTANGSSVLDDTVSGSLYGTWQYSITSGSTWNTWDASQDQVGNYIRYVASSVPSVRIRALLTQA